MERLSPLDSGSRSVFAVGSPLRNPKPKYLLLRVLLRSGRLSVSRSSAIATSNIPYIISTFISRMYPMIEGTSAAEEEYMERKQRTQINGSSVADDRQIEGTSATEDLQIEETSAAEEHTESVETSAAEYPQIEETSAAGEHTESREGTHWPKNSIFRAPAHIRSGRESYFEPKLVSIGPYYHGQENLKRMEHLKLRCITELWQKQSFHVVNHPKPLEADIPHRRKRSIYNVPVEPSLQERRGIDDVPLNQFMDCGEIARAYYKQELNHSDVEFVRMLVIDSCFIIRTIFSLTQEIHESMAFLDVNIKDVRTDLLLLENQIPLFFLRKVYEWLFPSGDHPEAPSFESVLETFICLDVPWIITSGVNVGNIEAAHLLDLYWRSSLSPPMYRELSELERDPSEQERHLSAKKHRTWEEIIDLSNTKHPTWREIMKHSSTEDSTWEEMSFESINAPMVIPNATELHNMAGVEFEKFKEKGYLDVIFSNGIIRMPRLKIDTRQTILLVNVIAFENCILPSMRIFGYYMKLMDALIDSEKDVALLQKCGVIYNTLSSHEKAATFFNDIGNICFTDNNTNPFFCLYRDVEDYYNSNWHRRSVILRKNYFSSPWAGISVIAGVTLLILSALQTFYTIYGYYKLNN